jgi:hypothetical protein
LDYAPDAEFTFGGNTYKGRDKIRGVVTSIKERSVNSRMRLSLA